MVITRQFMLNSAKYSIMIIMNAPLLGAILGGYIYQL